MEHPFKEEIHTPDQLVELTDQILLYTVVEPLTN